MPMLCFARQLATRRVFSTSFPRYHENPLGLPRNNVSQPPQMPRRGGIQKRPIPHVKRVIAVASGKGGVGKSTVAVNLAFALSTLRLRVGVLDLDIFGPSIPTLMGLQASEEPFLTPDGAIIPLMNHGMPTMSMGFLLPRQPDSGSTNDTPVVWRGLMVQKAVQQLLFDVDWRNPQGLGLDVLVVDMPPGTGDVPLTLGQLVIVDGVVIVSTPQDVALADVSKGIAMFRKVSVPITGIVLNQSHFLCPGCDTKHYLYGPPEGFRGTAARLGVNVLAELPLVPAVSQGGDAGMPYALWSSTRREGGVGGTEWLQEMNRVAEKLYSPE
ncbi:P-loop containing nucleoside triphosphate hydrolase protein [Roridomyces roridus]|uniref:P-loop containing nucleoside triphosphate hydrolase protein n=1 Tax=Roridomyces roridus TaxID=1738132 RepID=A0AAD7FIS0_9AGAR|nr:P-loop containing nucleoside triphosphate hydrolase protein [Roridomyces roridus]